MALQLGEAEASCKRKRDEENDAGSLFVKATPDRNETLDLDDDDSDDLDDSDEEGGDDDDQSVTGPCEYEEDDEPLPKCVAYDKDFAQVGEDLMSIPHAVAAIVDRNGCQSRRAQSCRSNAKGLTTMPRNKRDKIALLGVTGAGEWNAVPAQSMRADWLQEKVPCSTLCWGCRSWPNP